MSASEFSGFCKFSMTSFSASITVTLFALGLECARTRQAKLAKSFFCAALCTGAAPHTRIHVQPCVTGRAKIAPHLSPEKRIVRENIEQAADGFSLALHGRWMQPPTGSGFRSAAYALWLLLATFAAWHSEPGGGIAGCGSKRFRAWDSAHFEDGCH